MNDYCEKALEYLSYAYDPRDALFSFSSAEGGGGEIVNDFTNPSSLRYTINTFLGLSKAEQHGGQISWLGDVGDRVCQFVSQHERSIENPGDHGLLLALLAATDRTNPAVARSLRQLQRVVARSDAAWHLNMQELAWMLWGATAWRDSLEAEVLAAQVFELIRARFTNPASGMPRHSIRRYRAHTVSFGSVVYFLRAMYEYDQAFGSDVARELFMRCLQRVLALQGEDGGWPWLIDTRTGVPIDLYPLFSVHQDSMAMLFLFPAATYGVPGIDAVVERSLRWNLGENELGASLLGSEPCPWFYRSIERDAGWPRARRYLRTLGPRARRYPDRSERVRINRECRSYHLGWVLYVWAGRELPVVVDEELVFGAAPKLSGAGDELGSVAA